MEFNKINRGSFAWAVEQMKEGKKVTRNKYLEENSVHLHGMYLEDTYLMSAKDLKLDFSLDEFEATDWEIYEEPNKTLWDKMEEPVIGFEDMLKVDDVKEALKRFYDSIDYNPELCERMKELFGEELIK